MTRFAGETPKTERITFEADYSAENQKRCEGRKSVIVGCYCGAHEGEDVCDKCGAPFSVLVRCVDPHAHQVQLMVTADGKRHERPLELVFKLMTESQLQQRVEEKRRRLGRKEASKDRSAFARDSTSFASFVRAGESLALPVVNQDVVDRVQQAVKAGHLDEAACPDCSKVRSACLCDIPF